MSVAISQDSSRSILRSLTLFRLVTTNSQRIAHLPKPLNVPFPSNVRASLLGHHVKELSGLGPNLPPAAFFLHLSKSRRNVDELDNRSLGFELRRANEASRIKKLVGYG